jgi:adenosine kinase
VDSAKFYYIAGFFLTVSPETILKVAHHACEHDKPFCMNLAAPFISQFFRDRLLAAFPCIDVLFGNEVEYEAFAKEENMGTTDLVEIGKKISAYPKQGSRKRLVIITQGENPVICVQGDEVTTFDVPKLLPDQIVDTNGAGDAFVGGFLSKYILGKELSECVDCGVWASQQIIERPGATFPPECTYKGNYLKN